MLLMIVDVVLDVDDDDDVVDDDDDGVVDDIEWRKPMHWVIKPTTSSWVILQNLMLVNFVAGSYKRHITEAARDNQSSN